SLRLHGAVAACGNAGGVELNTTVLPLLLRGVAVLGIDSAQCPTPRRLQAWRRLADEMPKPLLDSLSTEIRLADLPAWAEKILKGQVRGRLVVDVNR
ncbi:MAG TPA: oxidoreductase, partial [Magnetospirillum sp.]|nr:oxidoreductase [Magnetospirillum sp.]